MKNKLGLYIERVQSGPTRLFGTNEDPSWTKKVWDLRNNGFISNINTGNSLNILMLSEIENGHIITIARCSTGRTDDYISAWIYVPCAIDITGKILVKIINIVQKEINTTNLDKELLDELFSRAYDAAPAKKICSNSTSEQIAFRYYGAGTTEELYEILDAPCQSYYRNFKTILLFDKASAAICANATDLTTRDIERMVVVPQPHSVDGWTPYIKNEIFDTPIYMRVGDKVELEWRRKGYAPIPKSFIVADNAKADAPRENEYRVMLSYNNIKVQDENRRSIDNYTLKIENQTVNPGCEIAISKDVITRAKVVITADYHEPYEQTCNLQPYLEKPGAILLKKKKLVYKFKIEDQTTGGYLTYECTPNRPLRECPIKGYELEINGEPTPHMDTYLKYKKSAGSGSGSRSKSNISIIIVAAVVALVLGSTIAWLSTWAYHRNEIKENKIEISRLTKQVQDLERKLHEKEYRAKLDKIVQYLNNTRWDREKMEDLNPILVNLWACLYNGDLEGVLAISEGNTELSKSKKFEALINAISEYKQHEGDVEFDVSDNNLIISDPRIHIDNYIKALKGQKVTAAPAQPEPKATTTPAKTAKTAKTAGSEKPAQPKPKATTTPAKPKATTTPAKPKATTTPAKPAGSGKPAGPATPGKPSRKAFN